MDWVKISEAAALSNRPARTIRHNALIGKFRAKKEGKDWYVDLNSLRENGWLPTESALSSKSSESSSGNTHVAGKSSANRKSYKENSAHPFRDVRSLGVYSELLELCRSETFKKVPFENIGDFMVRSLVNLGIGYFEFDQKNKLLAYRSARQNILHALVHLHLIETTHEVSDIKAVMETIGKIVPGIGGLIRRTEKRVYEKRPRSESPLQD